MNIIDYVHYIVPIRLTSKHARPIMEDVRAIEMLIGNDPVPQEAYETAETLIRQTDKSIPLYNEYKKILKKYGYLYPIFDEKKYILDNLLGKYVSQNTISILQKEMYAHRAYNIFHRLADTSPHGTSKPFEEMILRLGEQYTGAEIVRPIDLPHKNTKARRYDLYIKDRDLRIELKTTRVIDDGRVGKMSTRMMPYGLGKHFSTQAEQVKLQYFDIMILNIVATNISLYFLFTQEDVEKIIDEHFVYNSTEKEHIRVSLQHNATENAKDKEKQKYTREFIIAFNTYAGMSDLAKRARLVTFDVQKLVQKLTNL